MRLRRTTLNTTALGSNRTTTKKTLLLIIAGAVLLASCHISGHERAENRQAKSWMQGTWVDAETEELVFKAEGDTIYYSDGVSMPTYFKVVNDHLMLGGDVSYLVVKQTENQLWFKNQNGDVVKLNKSQTIQEEVFVTDPTPSVYNYTEVMKKDSVVKYGEQRYHWYIAINPTKFRVVKKTVNKDDIEVENVYYDNIIHLSVFQGSTQLFSSDLRKNMFNSKVPKNFLEQAVLGNLEYGNADQSGLHFNATLCIPDDAQCYVVELVIDYKGGYSMNLIEF